MSLRLVSIGKHTLQSLHGKKTPAITSGILKMMTDFSVEHLIVGATGIGYLVVGVLQWIKGDLPNGMIWTGYAFAQVGLWINLK